MTDNPTQPLGEEMARAIDAASGFNMPRDECVSYAIAAAAIAQRRVSELEAALTQSADALQSVMEDEYDAFYIRVRAALESARAALAKDETA